MSEFRRKVIIEEVAPAWEECTNPICDDTHGCAMCHGSGGRWHEAVKLNSDGLGFLNHDIQAAGEAFYNRVHKSTTLVREWICPLMEYHCEREDNWQCESCTAGPWRVLT